MPPSCLRTGPFRLRGRVQAAEDETGLAGVTLTLAGPEGCGDWTTTDAEGRYQFQGLASGDYTVVPAQDGCTFSPPARTVTIADADARASFRGRCP